jgi:hypothetical protein
VKRLFIQVPAVSRVDKAAVTLVMRRPHEEFATRPRLDCR